MSLTSKEIAAILGPVDEDLLAELLRSGASREELAEAWAWSQNDEALVNEGRPLPSGRVARLVDLLSPPEEEPER
ncbi:hypothetical protein [Teichococcus cervicalis]|uniref:Uncharacterized protein n=1 Tax=Pseudoroseomonas cervicalis ATCC 49957 TaxID=525371 RepID=D5RP12_9PROT|nr:hypothetical protein [Pseudoroseomonas cervicalis]EFH10957.1 hypothetical protein HMPREF0731_2823 [Pseudoroseomonas cervicalis ATCC 49957]